MNMSMKDGTTPLMTAVKLAVEEMVGHLLNYQVEVNATDNRGSFLLLLLSSAVNNNNKLPSL